MISAPYVKHIPGRTALTFRRDAQVGHDNQQRVGLHPQDVAGHIFIVQRLGGGDDARSVVHTEMSCKQTRARRGGVRPTETDKTKPGQKQKNILKVDRAEAGSEKNKSITSVQ